MGAALTPVGARRIGAGSTGMSGVTSSTGGGGDVSDGVGIGSGGRGVGARSAWSNGGGVEAGGGTACVERSTAARGGAGARMSSSAGWMAGSIASTAGARAGSPLSRRRIRIKQSHQFAVSHFLSWPANHPQVKAPSSVSRETSGRNGHCPALVATHFDPAHPHTLDGARNSSPTCTPPLRFRRDPGWIPAPGRRTGIPDAPVPTRLVSRIISLRNPIDHGTGAVPGPSRCFRVRLPKRHRNT